MKKIFLLLFVCLFALGFSQKKKKTKSKKALRVPVRYFPNDQDISLKSSSGPHQLLQRGIRQEGGAALDLVLTHIPVDALDDITGQGHIDLLGLAQVGRDVQLQHAPAHPGIVCVGVMIGLPDEGEKMLFVDHPSDRRWH